jgi:hypothetical protein
MKQRFSCFYTARSPEASASTPDVAVVTRPVLMARSIYRKRIFGELADIGYGEPAFMDQRLGIAAQP